MNFEDKLLLTKIRIQQWYEHWDGQVYVAFSGGKDSTILLHIVRSMYPEVKAVFNNTGLEFPEIKSFVKSVDNVVWLKPKLNYQDTVKKYGFAVISKEVSQKVNELKHTKSEKLRNIRLNGNDKGHGKLAKKWVHLAQAPFDISHKCCDILKKNPAKLFEKETGLKPIVGVMNSESSLRRTQHAKQGCNAYDLARPVSKPLSYWDEKDIYHYIDINNIKISKIYEMGYQRTGCAWCAFGVHLEKGENRFQRLKRTHPKIHNYAINKMGLKEPFDYLGLKYE
jgi:3'-phosphoadenosine 5'-phosphosulfate sulfotransferase (PAPS reductase)/FAD synthetase